MWSETLVLVLVFVSMVCPKPMESITTPRSPTQIGETIKQLTSQLISNGTSEIIMDTRTPPKIKQHVKKKIKPELLENSHAGVAIPIDEEALHLEETTKKLNFYKIERPTTNSGLSTWILLNHHTTKKPMKEEKNNTNSNKFVATEPNKLIKPFFKKRITTTGTPTTTSTTTTTTTTISTTTTIPTTLTTPKNKSFISTTVSSTTIKKPTLKLTKIKASVLSNALKKNNATVPMKTTFVPISSTPSLKISNEINVTERLPIGIETKEGESDLNNNNKNRRTSTKKKKNKVRRRRPSNTKNDLNTKIDKIENKEKPISAQLYNYLSREIIPTVGAGLLGLMVTAGLASYFLYPFGAARRNYDIDRRDKAGNYYYTDEYSGGIAEEEAIGKVIAGMPINNINSNNNNNNNVNYKTPTSRFVNIRKHQVENNYRGVDLDPITYNNNPYDKDIIVQSKETGYTVDDGRFVVGNIPDEVTPAVVPEHGPRSMRLKKRRRRRQVNESENEINDNDGTIINETTTTEIITTLTPSISSTMENLQMPDKVKTIIDLIKDLMHLKINLGLQLIQNATNSISRYISKIQSRIDEHYKSTYNKSHF